MSKVKKYPQNVAPVIKLVFCIINNVSRENLPYFASFLFKVMLYFICKFRIVILKYIQYICYGGLFPFVVKIIYSTCLIPLLLLFIFAVFMCDVSRERSIPGAWVLHSSWSILNTSCISSFFNAFVSTKDSY